MDLLKRLVKLSEISGFEGKLGSEKTHKEKPRKQNVHGIVPGFGGDFVYVFFLPHKE